MITLEEIYSNHGDKVSDKWELYINIYQERFEPYRNLPVNLFEIGIQNGGSLEVWEKYFCNAINIIGCDVNEACGSLKFESKKIKVVIGDASSLEISPKILDICNRFDIIIDDGSHHSADIVKAFARYFQLLSDGGIYVIEDLHCSYWAEYDGGLYHPESSMAFLKALTDVINFESWGLENDRGDVLSTILEKYDSEISSEILKQIHSIEFINSMCIIKKHEPNKNSLGKQRIFGTDESIQEGRLILNGQHIEAPDQTSSQWNVSFQIRMASLQEAIEHRDNRITQLETATHEKDVSIGVLSSEFADEDKIIAELLQLKSVQITKISELTDQLSERDIRISDLNDQVSAGDMSIKKYADRISDQQNQINELTKEIYIGNLNVHELVSNISDRDNKLSELYDEISNNNNIFINLKRKLVNLLR